MKRKMFILALGIILAMPCVLHAEEMEIRLLEVVNIGFIPGDDPMDGSAKEDKTPPRPNDFRATIDGNVLTVSIENEAIPYANLRVTRQSTHTLVVNRSFSIQAEELIPAAGMYYLEIETEGGMLVGSFEVE